MSEIIEVKTFPATWFTWETGEEFGMQIELLNIGFEYGIVLSTRDNEPFSCSLYRMINDYDLNDINREFFTNWAEEAQDPDATTRRYCGGYTDPSIFHLDLTCKALKTTIVLDAAQLAHCQVPDGAEHVWVRLTTADNRNVEGYLDPESTREAIARIAELGADNVTVILQAQLKLAVHRLESFSLSVQPKTKTPWDC